MSGKTLNVIYDGQCAFCIRALDAVGALDIRGVLRFHDAHRPETFELFPALHGADVEDAMFVVAEGEPLYRGFYAFRRVLYGSPLLWPLIPVFYFPGVSFVGTRVYAWVARNRAQFGCRSEVCSFPPPRAKRIQSEGRQARP